MSAANFNGPVLLHRQLGQAVADGGKIEVTCVGEVKKAGSSHVGLWTINVIFHDSEDNLIRMTLVDQVELQVKEFKTANALISLGLMFDRKTVDLPLSVGETTTWT